MSYASVLCENAIKTGRSVCLTATGTSMWPIIRNGMQATVSPMSDSLPEKGSLLLIKRPNGLMIHRYWGVISKEGDPLILTKGDANLAFDSPVPVSLIIGHVSLLKNSSGDLWDPNRGWLYLFGCVLCSSYNLARFWAKLCRRILEFQS